MKIISLLASTGQMGIGECYGMATTVGKMVSMLSLDLVKQVASVFTTTLHLAVTQAFKGD